MMNHFLKYCFILFFLFVHQSLDLLANHTNDNKANFSIYLVSDCDTCTYDPWVYDINKLNLDSVPLITSNDLEWYNWENHTFALKDSLDSIDDKIRLGKFMADFLMHKKYFVVVANNERIYLGIFWSGLSSQMTFHPFIFLPFIMMKARISIRNKSNDPRNAQKILNALKADNILKE